MAGDGVEHKNRYGSVWAGRRYRTLLPVVANWIASENAADNLNALGGGSEVALGSGNGRQSSTVSVSGNAAVSSSGGNGVGSGQEGVGGWWEWISACSG